MDIRQPNNQEEWNSYYDLRYRVLRQPWGQAKGSERNEGDETAHHFASWHLGLPLAIARLDKTNELGIVQVRFVAVEPKEQGKGLGKAMMQKVEEVAIQQTNKRIILHARENALHFYESIGYTIQKKSHLLFGEIQHFLMYKDLITS